MTGAVDDRTFLSDGRPYLNSRQAAIYCGFEPGPATGAKRTDPQMRSFYAWTYKRGIRPQVGRAVYRRADLDAAIRREPLPDQTEIDQARRLARLEVADSRRRAHLQLRRSSATAGK